MWENTKAIYWITAASTSLTTALAQFPYILKHTINYVPAGSSVGSDYGGNADSINGIGSLSHPRRKSSRCSRSIFVRKRKQFGPTSMTKVNCTKFFIHFFQLSETSLRNELFAVMDRRDLHWKMICAFEYFPCYLLAERFYTPHIILYYILYWRVRFIPSDNSS